MFDALRSVVGEARFSEDPDGRWRALPGWNPAVAHGIGTPPGCIVVPEGMDSLVDIARVCRSHGWRWGALGGRTSTRGQQTVDVAVDMTAMRSLDVDPVGLRARVGAGWSLDALEEPLLQQGSIHGHRLGSGKLATVGGAIATDAHGAFFGRYGSVRGAVMGTTWVSADGTVIHRQGEGARGWSGHPVLGTDAILVEAVLRLHPEPEARAWAILDFAGFDEAIEALRLVLRCDAAPALAGVFGRNQLVMAYEGDEMVQEACYRWGVAVALRSGGQVVGGTDEGEQWWEARIRSDHWAANRRTGYWADRVEAWASWERVSAVRDALVESGPEVAEVVDIEILHASRWGARVARSFVAQTDTDGWADILRRMRDGARRAGGNPDGPED